MDDLTCKCLALLPDTDRQHWVARKIDTTVAARGMPGTRTSNYGTKRAMAVLGWGA